MDAEKNVVEAARKLTDAVYAEHFGSSYKRVLVDCLLVNKLQAALSAYDAARKDSAPAPSEDRVREAAGRCVRALLMDSRCTEGDRLAIKKRGSDGNEHDLGAWSHDAALNVIAEALRPYVTPAPALPAGTVAVPIEVLRSVREAEDRHLEDKWPWHLMGEKVEQNVTALRVELDKLYSLLPPPPRPEPPKELVAEWAREARAAAADLYISTKGQSADGFRSGYVARCRAEWDAAQKGGG